MHYHDITSVDLKNGDGLRVVLWVAGCAHKCKGCQNPVTWNPEDGLIFDSNAKNEIFRALKKPYIAGITFSGGDPLYTSNRGTVYGLMRQIKQRFLGKTIWVYTGYTWDEIQSNKYLFTMMKYVDVLVDGRYQEELRDINYPWAGSTNKQLINVPETLRHGRVILHESD